MPDLVPLPGSERSELPGAQSAGPLNESQPITVTLVLRRRAQVPAALVMGPETVTHEELDEQYGAETDDIALVTRHDRIGLTVTETHQGSRRMKVCGTIAALSAAFGTTLTPVTSPQLGGHGASDPPVPVRRPVRAGQPVRDRHRRAGPRRPPGGPPAVPPADRGRRQPDRHPETVTPETVTPETVTPETATPGDRPPRQKR